MLNGPNEIFKVHCKNFSETRSSHYQIQRHWENIFCFHDFLKSEGSYFHFFCGGGTRWHLLNSIFLDLIKEKRKNRRRLKAKYSGKIPGTINGHSSQFRSSEAK